MEIIVPGNGPIAKGIKAFFFMRSLIVYFAQDFHFLSTSRLSRTRNIVILRIKDKGSGFSNGNWIDPLAVLNFERLFSKAFTADGVG